MDGEELMNRLKKFSGVMLSLFRRRLGNGYCRMNPFMDVDTNAGRYQVCLRKGDRVEFRLPSRITGVKQMMRRYELCYMMLDFAVNRPNASFKTFLKAVAPIVSSMYGHDEQKVNEILTLSEAFNKTLRTGTINRETMRMARPTPQHDRQVGQRPDPPRVVRRTGVVSSRTRSLRPSVCTDADESKRTKRKLTQMGGAPTANTIMAQADYTNKIQFWTEQLALASNPILAHKTRYTLTRCQESLAHFEGKQLAIETNRVALPDLTEAQAQKVADADLLVSNLIVELSESDPRWTEIWEEFDLLEAIEAHIKKLQS